ncbi:MAG TPA: pitrilysin family protein [Gemmatimonadaceae bacterium]|nr:pitrilysin family protein [Gemmatimonadaceae bacterium]
MRSVCRSLCTVLALTLTITAGAVAPPTVLAQNGATSASPSTSTLDIPFTKYVLPNGLTLIVHEDHKAPIVAVNIWYHVGSKNEQIGHTGFAHLFEHLMFNGTEHYNDDYFKTMEKVGATDMNGTTNNDRTNYFEDVPTSALDLTLWMESERMGHLLGAIDTAKLNEQRGVVQNEKRQDENQPYGQVFNMIEENTYPAGHPYSHSVIGSMEDLNAASLEDVKNWFRTYYGPTNAVMVIAGDITPDVAHEKVLKYFGDIPAGPPIAKQRAWVAKMTGTHRMVMQDRVPQARVYMVWNVPQWGSADADYLDLVSDVLSSGKTSRLYKRLVYDDQIATDVGAGVAMREIGSQFIITATAKPGGDLAAVEKAVDEELARFLADGPTAEELQRIKTQSRANFIRGSERIGGFGGKSDILATSMVFGGDPAAYKTTLDRVANATAEDLRNSARTWLSDGKFVLEVQPYAKYDVVASTVDRSKLPAVATPPAPRFPTTQTATLSNGLKIVLAHRDAVPLVSFNLLVDTGFAADQFGVPGQASLAMSMLDEGTTSRSALQISDDLARLGASLGAGSSLDASTVSISTLKENMDAALAIYADVILHPSFPATDFDRLKKQQLARIQREKVTPVQMALRVFPELLYGAKHAYGIPLTGSGTESSVASLTREQLATFHDTWFEPNNATLVVVGATTMDEIKPKLEALFKDWKRGSVPKKNIATVAQQPKSTVYLIDRPGSQQSIIFAGNIAPPKNNPDEIAIEAMNDALGGAFTSRINMNLREDKHWSYGASSLVYDAKGQRPFIALAPVQTDKTAESLRELSKELHGVVSDHPITADELTKVQDDLTLSLPGRWETNGAVGASIGEMVRFGLPLDYYDRYASAVRALTVADLDKAAREVVHPDNLVWVVVGDRAKIEAGVRALNLGPVEVLDADGKAEKTVGR